MILNLGGYGMYIINYKNLRRGYNRGVSISNKVSGWCTFSEYNYNGCFFQYEYLIPENDFKGKIENENKIRDYIKYYYVNVLSKLDPNKIYNDLEWECLVTFDDGEFSHGYIVSAWLELFLDVDVPCVKNDALYVKDIKDIKPKWTIDILEDEIKKTIDNMRGFNSVRALYLFNQSEELERKAEQLEERILNDKTLTREQIYKLSDTASGYRQGACYRRCDADMAEDAWRERRLKLIEESKNENRKKRNLFLK